MRSKKGIYLSQRKYVLDLLSETGKLGTKPSGTPMMPNQQLVFLKRRQVSLLIKENETNAQSIRELYKEQNKKRQKQPNKLPKKDLSQNKGKRPKQTKSKE